ncbi:hypothetical protein GCM10009429_13300 [Dyella marensis]
MRTGVDVGVALQHEIGANGQAESVNAAPAHMGAAYSGTRLNTPAPVNARLTSNPPARFIVPHFAQARMPAPVDTKTQWSPPCTSYRYRR